jgi:hypothetical protein
MEQEFERDQAFLDIRSGRLANCVILSTTQAILSPFDAS